MATQTGRTCACRPPADVPLTRLQRQVLAAVRAKPGRDTWELAFVASRQPYYVRDALEALETLRYVVSLPPTWHGIYATRWQAIDHADPGHTRPTS